MAAILNISAVASSAWVFQRVQLLGTILNDKKNKKTKKHLAQFDKHNRSIYSVSDAAEDGLVGTSGLLNLFQTLHTNISVTQIILSSDWMFMSRCFHQEEEEEMLVVWQTGKRSLFTCILVINTGNLTDDIG